MSNWTVALVAVAIASFAAVVLRLSTFQSVTVLILLWLTVSVLRAHARWREMKRNDPRLLVEQSNVDDVNTGRIWREYLAHQRYGETVRQNDDDR